MSYSNSGRYSQYVPYDPASPSTLTTSNYNHATATNMKVDYTFDLALPPTLPYPWPQVTSLWCHNGGFFAVDAQGQLVAEITSYTLMIFLDKYRRPSP